MTENDEQSHDEWRRDVRESYQPLTMQWNNMADETTRLMLNALLILNGGGLAAIPALQAIAPTGTIPLDSLAASGAIFFGGLVFSLVAGVVTIWNFRLLASQRETEMNALLRRGIEARKSKFAFVPSDTLTELANTAARLGKRSIPNTYRVGWGCGVASAVLFTIGGATIGGKLNPICKLLGPVCFT